MKESFYCLDDDKLVLGVNFNSSSEMFEWRATDE
jgi:hypothetical protein